MIWKSGSRSCFLQLVAGLLCVWGPVSGNGAEAERDPPRLIVRIGDLNLNDSKGVAVAYGRIEWAAERVCPLADSGDYWLRVSAGSCIIQAISRAIGNIASPELAAYAQSQRSFRLQQARDQAP